MCGIHYKAISKEEPWLINYFLKTVFRTEMKEGTSIETYLKHMKELTDKLAAIGAPIEEKDQVVTLLGSLPTSYCTLVSSCGRY